VPPTRARELALQFRDVDLKDGTLHVRGTKTIGSDAPVPIIEALAVELRDTARGSRRVGFT
jgi:integrase